MSSDYADIRNRRNEPSAPPYPDDDHYYGNGVNQGPRASRRTNENLAYQMFASLPAFAQAAVSFAKYIVTWLFYKGLFGLLLLTPIGPIWLLYEKGLAIISYIPIVMVFLKDMADIGRKCYDDAMNKTGYMDSKQLKRDLRASLLRLLGYEYQKPEQLDEEMKDDNEDERESLRYESTSKERFRDTIVYTVTLGNYPTYLTNHGIVPPTRQIHRTRQASKSRMTSFVLCCAGLAYYILSGKFLFKNVQAIQKMEKEEELKRKDSEDLANGEVQKKFNWRYLYAAVIIAFGMWWIFASHTEPGAHPYMNFFLSILLSPFTFFIGNAYHLIIWTWSKFFAICFWFPSLILGLGKEQQETPRQNDYAYAKQNVH